MEENKRKNKKQAKKQIVMEKLRKYLEKKSKKRIEKEEGRLGRPLTKAEIRKINNKIVNGMGIQMLAISAAAFTTISFAAGYISSKPQLPAPEEPQTSDVNTPKNNTNDFRDDIKVGVPITVDPKNQINEINNTRDMINWIKGLYISKEKEIKGQSAYNTSSIEIRKQPVSRRFKTSDGKYVASIENPTEVMLILEQNGVEYEDVGEGNIYTISIANNGKIIDCATEIVNEEKPEENGFHDVIIGENYEEMKDENLCLSELRYVLPKSFYLIDLYEQLESKPGNEYLLGKIEQGKEWLYEAYEENFPENKQEKQSPQEKNSPTNEYEIGD